MAKRYGVITGILLALIISASPTYAGEAEVVFVDITKAGGGYYFEVTLRHADTGWEHYADWWRVRTQDGKEIARRVLYHPHVNEQPFTRALDSAVKIPDGIDAVIVEGHDLVHGYGGKTVRVDLAKPRGADYRIE